MSPHAVNNFVSDLVLMAQAMERLPQVEAELAKAHADIAHFADVEERTRADLAQSRDYAASLEQRIHDLEVARDDAELRFLEADERTSRALDFIKATFGAAGSLIQALEPAKAMPMPEPEHDFSPIQPKPEPQVEADPFIEANPSQGQSEPDPTASSIRDQSALIARPSEQDVMGLSQQTSLATPAEEAPPVGPYTNRRYIDVPNFCTLHEWLVGGGTEADYHWRPSHSASF